LRERTGARSPVYSNRPYLNPLPAPARSVPAGFPLLRSDHGETGESDEVAAQIKNSAKLSTNWIMGDLSAQLNKDGLEIISSPISAPQLAGLLKRIVDGTISGKIAKEVFAAMWAGEGDADAIIETKGLKQVSDSGAIEKIVDEIIAANPAQVAEYRSGKEKVFGFFVGLAMKVSKGKANPAQLNEILKKKLAG